MAKRIIKVGRYKVEDGTRPGPVGEELSLDELARYQRRAARFVLTQIEHVEPDVIRYARKALGLTQVELASFLGVDSATVSRWETGAESFKRPVQLALVALLAAAEGYGVRRDKVDLAATFTPQPCPPPGEVTLKAPPGEAILRAS